MIARLLTRIEEIEWTIGRATVRAFELLLPNALPCPPQEPFRGVRVL